MQNFIPHISRVPHYFKPWFTNETLSLSLPPVLLSRPPNPHARCCLLLVINGIWPYWSSCEVVDPQSSHRVLVDRWKDCVSTEDKEEAHEWQISVILFSLSPQEASVPQFQLYPCLHEGLNVFGTTRRWYRLEDRKNALKLYWDLLKYIWNEPLVEKSMEFCSLET